ncbi:hypothetical protein [[Limnothrix rosea] IAM M-220]|uniref:hypothetical protein n=1 Tax=[Limnothrix rosea] IAM M-220 TaxID=454133 RepID=UPI00096ABCC6|nr:hypothetical protein [[Limnothrix rosea] IAM M-220]
MSEPPVTAPWEFDQSRFIPVAKTTDSKPIPKAKTNSSPLFGLAIMAIAALLSGTAFFWLVGQAFNEWSADRETSARQELARIRSCIN